MVRAGAFLSSLSRHAKAISLVVGFLFGTVGAVWSLVCVDRLGREMSRLSNAKADLARQMQALENLASDYFMANQQGDLIFMLAQQAGARPDLAGLIYKGNLLDRAAPVRQMIGALAMAGQLDYRRTYDAYEKLNREVRDHFSFEHYDRLKQAEKTVIEQGQARVPLLLDRLSEIDKALNANQASQERNREVGIAFSIFGSLMLLLANLIVEGRKR